MRQVHNLLTRMELGNLPILCRLDSLCWQPDLSAPFSRTIMMMQVIPFHSAFWGCQSGQAEQCFSTLYVGRLFFSLSPGSAKVLMRVLKQLPSYFGNYSVWWLDGGHFAAWVGCGYLWFWSLWGSFLSTLFSLSEFRCWGWLPLAKFMYLAHLRTEN